MSGSCRPIGMTGREGGREEGRGRLELSCVPLPLALWVRRE